MWVIYNAHFVYSLGLASLGNDDVCGIKVATDTAWKKRKLNNYYDIALYEYQNLVCNTD